MKITFKQYLRKARCPKCGSSEIFTPSDGFLAQIKNIGYLYGHCTECGAQWNEVWKRTGLKLLDVIVPEYSRKWVRPWKNPEEKTVEPKFGYRERFGIEETSLPEKGTARTVGAFIICNDNGILRVYEQT